MDAVLDEGARDIDYKLWKIYAALKRDPHSQEKQRLLAERQILWNDPHYIKYFAVCVRLLDAQGRRDDYIERAMMAIPQESRPAPLQEIPVLETVAVVGDGKNAESDSPNSSVSDPTPKWGLNSWWRGWFNKNKAD